MESLSAIFTQHGWIQGRHRAGTGGSLDHATSAMDYLRSKRTADIHRLAGRHRWNGSLTEENCLGARSLGDCCQCRRTVLLG